MAVPLVKSKGLGAIIQLSRSISTPKWVQESILKGAGGLALAQAQRAFKEQQLEDKRWPERYPKQKEPFVNIAGVVADFLEGRKKPPDRRFDRRPAGIDTAETLRSLTPGKSMRMDGQAVVVGTPFVKKGSKIQFGGRSRQPVNKQVKDLLGEHLKRGRKRIKAGYKKSQPPTKQDAGLAKLGWLMNKNTKELVTNSVPRPYLGLTHELTEKIIDHVAEVLRGFEDGGAVKIEKK